MTEPYLRISDADRERVNRAVRDAESVTSAELVPVVAQCSGRYDRAEDVVGLWGGLLALAVVWLMLPSAVADSGSWGHPSPGGQLVALLAAVVAGFLVGAILASRLPGLRRPFTPHRQMAEEVLLRARSVFYDQRVHHTAAGSGLLLYVSLYERMAAVIADQSVLEKLGQDQIDSLCQELTQQLQHRTPVDALCATLEVAGQRLRTVLPRSEDDVNELADALVVVE